MRNCETSQTRKVVVGRLNESDRLWEPAQV